MKTLASLLLGTTALAALTIGVAQPVAARDYYAARYGYGTSLEEYRHYCRMDWYRHRYWDFCRRLDGRDDAYSLRFRGDDDGYRSYDNDDRYRYRHHRRDDNDDAWNGGGEGRRGDWDDR